MSIRKYKTEQGTDCNGAATDRSADGKQEDGSASVQGNRNPHPALIGEHPLNAFGSPGGFHPDARRSLKCCMRLVGFASPMIQSTISYLACHRINHCYLLKTCVKIASD